MLQFLFGTPWTPSPSSPTSDSKPSLTSKMRTMGKGNAHAHPKAQAHNTAINHQLMSSPDVICQKRCSKKPKRSKVGFHCLYCMCWAITINNQWTYQAPTKKEQLEGILICQGGDVKTVIICKSTYGQVELEGSGCTVRMLFKRFVVLTCPLLCGKASQTRWRRRLPCSASYWLLVYVQDHIWEGGLL